MSKEYASFNIEDLEWKLQRKLEFELDKSGISFKDHKLEVAKQISKVTN
jgi:hypothetical protein